MFWTINKVHVEVLNQSPEFPKVNQTRSLIKTVSDAKFLLVTIEGIIEVKSNQKSFNDFWFFHDIQSIWLWH